MNARTLVATRLATAWLSGTWRRDELESRSEDMLGRGRRRLIRKLVGDVWERTVTPYPPPPYRLVAFLLASPFFDRATKAGRTRAVAADPVLEPPGFSPVPPIPEAPFPKLTTPRDLADWLDVSLPHLDWFADTRRQHADTAKPALQHYNYAWIPKRKGRPRLIEAPKRRLKAIQRQILHDILDHLPAHDRAHGFVKGRSCLSAAQTHAGESVVATLDLREFFITTPLSRVHGLFRCIGYPWPVARLLTGLCSTSTPAGVFNTAPVVRGPAWAMRSQYRSAHLPQGAPTSPALANLCAWRLDCRLSGLARHCDAGYTRYADDLAFSGDDEFAGRIDRFLASAASIVEDEGYTLNPTKTRVMRRGGRQRVTGLVVNDHLNVARTDFDALKATLHNCRRDGPEGQNRGGHADFRAHLNGRVTWVENVNPRRGRRLRWMFERIGW